LRNCLPLRNCLLLRNCLRPAHRVPPRTRRSPRPEPVEGRWQSVVLPNTVVRQAHHWGSIWGIGIGAGCHRPRTGKLTTGFAQGLGIPSRSADEALDARSSLPHIYPVTLGLTCHRGHKMPRHIVCLTFDFDTMSSFIAHGMTTPTPL